MGPTSKTSARDTFLQHGDRHEHLVRQIIESVTEANKQGTSFSRPKPDLVIGTHISCFFELLAYIQVACGDRPAAERRTQRGRYSAFPSPCRLATSCRLLSFPAVEVRVC